VTRPFEVVIEFEKNVAKHHRPERMERQSRTETVWACSRAQARRITQGRFGAPAKTVTPLWTDSEAAEVNRMALEASEDINDSEGLEETTFE